MMDSFFAIVDVVVRFLTVAGPYLNWLILFIVVGTSTWAGVGWERNDRVGMFFFGVASVSLDVVTAPVFGLGRQEVLMLSTGGAHYTAMGYGFMISSLLASLLRPFLGDKKKTE